MSKGRRGIGRKTEGKKTKRDKRVRGRPVEKEWPDQIPDSPENIARAILNTPPKKDDEWEYMKRERKQRKES